MLQSDFSSFTNFLIYCFRLPYSVLSGITVLNIGTTVITLWDFTLWFGLVSIIVSFLIHIPDWRQ